MKKHLSALSGWIVILMILLQLVPLNRIEPPGKAPESIPSEVLAVLKNHCFSCHSGNTRWPRSAWIAPLSWYVTSEVRQARQALDFSGYDSMSDTAKSLVAETVSGAALTGTLSGHGTIPGFPAIHLSEAENTLLTSWQSNNNREHNRTIINSFGR